MIKLERNSLVWGIVGNLGGGKTLSGVDLAVRSLRDGFAVITNVTLDIDLIVKEFGIPWARKLYFHVSLDDPSTDPFKWPCGDPRGSGGDRRVIVLLDEVAEWLDQYSRANDPRIKRLWSWLRHSSKRSQDVIVICQRQEYINKVVRTLIARWIWVDDLAVYRIPKLKIKFPFMSGFVMQNVYDRQGNRIGSVSFLKKSEVGRFYNTAECLNFDGSTYNFVYTVPPVKYSISKPLLFLFISSFLYLFYLLLL